MNRLSVGIAIGMAFASAAIWLYLGRDIPGHRHELAEIVRDIRDLPRMSMADVDAHRADRFESLDTLEEMLQLPSEFAQSEALYVVAGRADSAGVQKMIYEATRIADSSDRRGAYSILFSRLADIDPHTAVVIAGRPPFADDQWVESSFWRAWSRLDLDAALLAAKDLTPTSRKERAAQAIYGAHGFGGNGITEHIEEVLGVPPSRWVRSQHIESLASDSPESAIAFANALPKSNERSDAFMMLGSYLGRTRPNHAESYARLIESAQLRAQYENGVMNAIASSNPAIVLDRWLADPTSRKYAASVGSAITQLVSADIARAIAYYDAAKDSQTRTMLASTIAQAMAVSDPRRALEWARNNDPGGRQQLHMQAIAAVAATNPALAMDAANNFEPASQRGEVISVVVMSMAQSDPALAVSALDQLPDGPQKQQTVQYLLSAWAQTDAKAAMDWAMQHRTQNDANVLRQVSSVYIHQYPQDAIHLLPSLDAATARNWSLRIVGALVNTESLSSATAFVQQYKGTEDYAQMQAILIPHIAQQDLAMAKVMVDQMEPGSHRDGAMSALIAQKAGTDPVGAIAWLESIPNESGRAAAVDSVVSTWSHTDPGAASRWVESLRSGVVRDNAVVALLNSSGDYGESELWLINRIDDAQKKSQAKIMYVYKLARLDPDGAKKLIGEMDLGDVEREQLEQIIDGDRYGYEVYDY